MFRRFSLAVVAVHLLSASQYSIAATLIYTANLSGASEIPPTGSSATGFTEVDFDNVAQTLRVRVTFSGLSSPTTASHIHAGMAPPGSANEPVATVVPAFPGFPLGVMSGFSDSTLDLTQAASYNPTFVTSSGSVAAAEAALVSSIAAGTAYLNIHTTTFPGGEIRGYLALAVPEPTSLILLGTGVVGVLAYGSRRIARTRT